MRDLSYTLHPTLTAPEPPFVSEPILRPPWTWRVTDRLGRETATARTRAGIRLAAQALHARRAHAADPHPTHA